MAPRIVFEQELKVLKEKVMAMGKYAESSYNSLVEAVEGQDNKMLETLLDNDRQIIDMQRSIEAKCLILITTQQPVAGDLRTISAALKVVTDIERVGDHVSDMAELFLRMEQGYSISEQEPKIISMMKEASAMLSMAVSAFVEMDVVKAQEVIDRDDIVDDYFNQVKEEMMESIRTQNPDADKVVDLLMIAKYLEKVGDHAVNIGEWTIFQVTGEMEQVRIM